MKTMLIDEEDTTTCPLCNGPLGILGVLGTRVHYRCRNCGAEASTAFVVVDPEDSADDRDDHPSERRSYGFNGGEDFARGT